MGLSAEVGTFTEKLTTGDQTISLADSGITPKVILISSANVLSDGAAVFNAGIFGIWADDSNAQAVITFRDADGATTMETSRHFSGAKIILNTEATGAEVTVGAGSAAVASVAAGSFTLTWANVQGDARKFNYLVLGGTDITNVDLNIIAAATSDTTVSYNIGFEPDCALVIGAGTTTNPGGAQAYVFNIGASDGTTQISLSSGSVDNVADAKTQCRYAAGRFIDTIYDDAEVRTATIAFDADGYDLTWDWTSGVAVYYAILAIKGIRAKVVDVDTPIFVVPVTQNVTGAPAQPVAALLFTAGNANSNIANNIAASIGFGANASQQANCSWTSDDGEGTSVTDRSQEQDEVLQMPAMNGAAPTEEANWGGVTASGFDLNWTSGDITQRNFGGIMFIPAATTGHLQMSLLGIGA